MYQFIWFLIAQPSIEVVCVSGYAAIDMLQAYTQCMATILITVLLDHNFVPSQELATLLTCATSMHVWRTLWDMIVPFVSRSVVIPYFFGVS